MDENGDDASGEAGEFRRKPFFFSEQDKVIKKKKARKVGKRENRRGGENLVWEGKEESEGGKKARRRTIQEGVVKINREGRNQPLSYTCHANLMAKKRRQKR